MREAQPPGAAPQPAAAEGGVHRTVSAAGLDQDRAVRALPALLPHGGRRQRRQRRSPRCAASIGARAARLRRGRTRRLARDRGTVQHVGPTRSSEGGGDRCLTIAPPSANARSRAPRQVRAAGRGGAASCQPTRTAVAHPCDEVSLESAVEARRARPDRADPGRPRRAHPRRRRQGRSSIIGACRSSIPRTATNSAAKAVEQVRLGNAEALMKGSLHTDELMAAVVAQDRAASAPPGASATASSWTCPATPTR